jgi:hypothetical protein
MQNLIAYYQYDSQTKKFTTPLFKWESEEAPVNSTTIAPDSSKWAIAYYDEENKQWTYKEGEPLEAEVMSIKGGNVE